MTHSGEPDDPKNPQRKFPPMEPIDQTISELRRLARQVNAIGNEHLRKGIQFTEELKSFLGYCFIAETNLKASEAQLVVRHTPNSTKWFFEKKAKTSGLEAEVNRLREQNINLRRRLDDLEASQRNSDQE